VELPGDLRQYLPPDHLVFLLCDLVEELDLRAITSVYEHGDGRGQPPYHPVLMTKLLVYAYCQGVTSSRQIMGKTYEDLAFLVLCVGQHPDFRTISDFRERHLAAFREIFTQTVRLAQQLGLVRLEHVAQDGTKVLANASKHKAMTYERMTQTEERLGQEIAALLAQAQQDDAAEDARYGADHRGDADPAAVAGEVAFRDARRARIRVAKAALEARIAAEAAAQAPVPDDQRGQVQLLAATPAETAVPPPAAAAVPAAPAAAPPAVPSPTAQANFTDPESRIMPSSQGFVQAYNAQAAVDSAHQIIVACAVCQETTDTAQLCPLFDQVRQTTGAWPAQASADSGYWSEPNVAALTAHGIDVYLPPPRPRRGADGSRSAEQTTPAKAAMQAKLTTPTGQQRYSRRKETAEPVFGQMKEARGLRRFRTRGLAKVRGEWALWCATHNLLKLARGLRSPRARAVPAALVPALALRGAALRRAGAGALWRLGRYLDPLQHRCGPLTTLSQTGS
jgi:transposase